MRIPTEQLDPDGTLTASIHDSSTVANQCARFYRVQVGRVNLLMIAVDNGADRFICAGPVLSPCEFEVLGGPRQIDDTEWRYAPPVWRQGYLVPIRRS